MTLSPFSFPTLQHNLKSNVVNSLTEVLQLLQEKRVETLQMMQTEHDSTAQWLQDSIRSFKRKLGDDTPKPLNSTQEKSEANATAAVTLSKLITNDSKEVQTWQAAASKKVKIESITNQNILQTNNTASILRRENQESSDTSSSIFKEPPFNSQRPLKKHLQQQCQPKATINMSIKASQLTVPIYHDEFSSHPRYLAIMSMKVQELRKELRSKDLETGGLKKELQQRLLAALSDANMIGNATENPVIVHTMVQDIPQVQSTVNHATFDKEQEFHESNPANKRMPSVSIHPSSDNDAMSLVDHEQSQPSTSVAALIAAREEAAKTQDSQKFIAPPVSQSFVKNTATLFSPNKITSKFQQPRPHEVTLPAKPSKALSPFASIKQSIVKTATNLLSVNKSEAIAFFAPTTKAGANSQVDAIPGTNLAKQGEAATEEVIGSNNADENIVAAPAPAVHKVSAEAKMETPLTASMSSAVKDKQKLLADARKQRLAELRCKSKPLNGIATSSSTSQLLKSSNNSKPDLVKQISSSTSKLLAVNPKEEDKRTLMTAKIREKHAALKTTKIPLQSSLVSNLPTIKPVVGADFSPKKDDPLPASDAPARPPPVENTSVTLNPDRPITDLNPRSPLDTYQISDREGSDSDDESDDSGAGPKKKIPEWAQKENLIVALKQQYDENGNRLDPDSLFPEVETCDLEAIFDKKRNRFKARTSSGNWTKDRVTVAEKLVYKRAMGFNTKTS